MALVKYMLFLEEKPIAIKYDYQKKRLTVGGDPKQLIQMKSIINDYFGKSTETHKKFPARNKVRMDFDYPENNFEEVIQKMMSHGMRIQNVQSFGRLIR